MNLGQYLRDYFLLVKFKLTLTVVGSAVFGYFIGAKLAETGFDWKVFLGVALGGFFTVAASNGINQLIEKDSDALMTRTNDRPIAQGRISVAEARIFCLLSGLAGFALLWFLCNPLSAWLGLISLVLYAFIYTPLKKTTPLAVMIGAFPGALPPLIGWTAVHNQIDEFGLLLFGIQFFWQFPHFWALAWMLHDDYQKAGYWLLPTLHGRSRPGAIQILIYTCITIAISIVPVFNGMSEIGALYFILPAGLYFLYRAIRLAGSLDMADARQLFFASLAYNPLVFTGLLIF